MKETIEIKNFGPIPYVNIEIKRLTIFIGSQGTGKSTISKLLTIFRDVFWHWSILNGQRQMLPFIAFKVDQYFKPSTYICYTFGDVIITYNEGAFTYRNGDQSIEQCKATVNATISQVSESVLHKLGYSKIEDVHDRDLDLLLANFRTLLYIPAERIMASQLSASFASLQLAKVPLGNPILEYMSLFEKAQKSTPRFEVPFLNVVFENKEGRQIVGVKDGTEEHQIPLDACSSGIQSALPLIMVMNYCCKEKYFDSFVVEEPEQNLFPVNQKELLRLLFRLWKNKTGEGSNLVITTHSPYTLTCVNVELLAGIIGAIAEYADAVSEIIPREDWLNPDEIAVYSLDSDTPDYANNLINPKTRLIGVNSIDSVSEIIGSEYNKLFKLYQKQLRG